MNKCFIFVCIAYFIYQVKCELGVEGMLRYIDNYRYHGGIRNIIFGDYDILKFKQKMAKYNANLSSSKESTKIEYLKIAQEMAKNKYKAEEINSILDRLERIGNGN